MMSTLHIQICMIECNGNHLLFLYTVTVNRSSYFETRFFVSGACVRIKQHTRYCNFKSQNCITHLMQTSGLGLAASANDPDTDDHSVNAAITTVPSSTAAAAAAAAAVSGNASGGTLRPPRPRNKMGRRPSWSEAEVLAAVQSLLEHPEGNARGAEAQAAWHERLRASFMIRFRQLAATNPTLAARQEVWANRSARKIISEARSALSNCRVLHAGKMKGTDNELDFAYPAVYDWLLRHTTEFHAFDTSNVNATSAAVTASAATVATTAHPLQNNEQVVELDDGSVANAAAIAAVAAANPMPPRATSTVKMENGEIRRAKRPRVEKEEEDRIGTKFAIMEAETNRQHAELAAWESLFGFGSGAPKSEAVEFKRLLRRNAMMRARIEVEIDLEKAGRDGSSAALASQWRAGGFSRSPVRASQQQQQQQPRLPE